MSRDYNRVILTGRLARDPEIKLTPSNTKTARISLACGREWKDKTTGEKKQQTEFYSVQAWGATADVLERYCKKGKLLLVEGRLHSYSYDDAKTGTRKYVTDVTAENIIMLADGRGNAQAGASAPSAQPQYYPGDVDMSTLRNEAVFEEDFPLDFSELSGSGNSDIQIPF